MGIGGEVCILREDKAYGEVGQDFGDGVSSNAVGDLEIVVGLLREHAAFGMLVFWDRRGKGTGNEAEEDGSCYETHVDAGFDIKMRHEENEEQRR